MNFKYFFQVTATEGAPISRASSWCIAHRTPYFRLSAPLCKEIPMDSRDDRDLARMMWDCLEYTYTHREYIEKMCVLIRKIGYAWRRRDLFQPPNSLHCDMQTQTSGPSTPSTDNLSKLANVLQPSLSDAEFIIRKIPDNASTLLERTTTEPKAIDSGSNKLLLKTSFEKFQYT